MNHHAPVGAGVALSATHRAGRGAGSMRMKLLLQASEDPPRPQPGLWQGPPQSGEIMGFQVSRPGFESWLCHL